MKANEALNRVTAHRLVRILLSTLQSGNIGGWRKPLFCSDVLLERHRQVISRIALPSRGAIRFLDRALTRQSARAKGAHW